MAHADDLDALHDATRDLFARGTITLRKRTFGVYDVATGTTGTTETTHAVRAIEPDQDVQLAGLGAGEDRRRVRMFDLAVADLVGIVSALDELLETWEVEADSRTYQIRSVEPLSGGRSARVTVEDSDT